MKLKRYVILLALIAFGCTTYGQEVIEGTLPKGYVAVRELDAKQYRINIENANKEIKKLKLDLANAKLKFDYDSLEFAKVMNDACKDFFSKEKQYKDTILENNKSIDAQRKAIWNCSSRLDKQNYKKFIRKNKEAKER